MQAYSIGLSALTASERALSLVGQNIANAGTPGYHRQVLNLAPRVLGGVVGAGVDAQGITRLREAMLENSLTAGQSRTARLEAELSVYRQLEAQFAPGPGTLTDRTQQLFNQIQTLAQAPDDLAQRGVVVSTAASLAGEINELNESLGQLRGDLTDRVKDGVSQLNDLAVQVSDFNRQIQSLERSGQPTADLRDLRDQAIGRIADLVDVRVVDQAFGVANVMAGNAPLVIGSTTTRFGSGADSNGLYISVEGSTAPISLSGGQLGGWVSAHNDILTRYQPRLDTFARELAGRLDAIQATGLPLGGAQASGLGARPVSSDVAALATVAGLPVQAGSLFLSVTDQGTGQRTLTEIPFDPTTQSLQDLAAAITTAGGGQVQGSVASGNRLQVQAQAGYTFDFAGRSPSSPTNLVMNGSALPRVTGVYTGPDNGSYTFQVNGSGTIGSTPNLMLQARDASNNVVATVNIGSGYTPDTLISVGNGLKVSLGAGTTANGSFAMPVVANADTTGSLAALGLNTLFRGTDAGSLQVRQEILDDPSLLAASRDGQPGDASNLARMIDLSSEQVFGGGTLTFTDDLAGLTADLGSAVRSRSDQQTALTSLQQNLQVQQQAVSGVDPNEELTNMLQFQRSFQMAARFISTVNNTLDSLLELVR